MILVPSWVSPEEQQMIAKLKWESDCCKEQSAELLT